MKDGNGSFDGVVRLLEPHTKRTWLDEQVQKLEPYGGLPGAR